MDPFTIFLVVVITILTVLLVITGIQVIFILRQASKTLSHVNNTIDTTHNLIQKIANPFSSMNSISNGVKAGLQIADHISAWAKERNKSSQGDFQNE